MRFSRLKWMLIVAALFVAGGNGHAFADHAAPKIAEPCATHHHHDAGHQHDDCCCSCFNCPAGLIAPFEANAPGQIAYDLHLTPSLATALANRTQPPELDPPRPSALS